jgi:hypothetical protein
MESAFWHMSNSDDEIKKLRDYKTENLRRPHERDDDAPEKPPRS